MCYEDPKQKESIHVVCLLSLKNVICCPCASSSRSATVFQGLKLKPNLLHGTIGCSIDHRHLDHVMIRAKDDNRDSVQRQHICCVHCSQLEYVQMCFIFLFFFYSVIVPSVNAVTVPPVSLELVITKKTLMASNTVFAAS